MTPVRVTLAAIVLVFAMLAPLSNAEEGTRGADEAALREAGLGSDGPALLDFFRKRTLDETDRSRLAATVRLLGHDAYSVRERASRD